MLQVFFEFPRLAFVRFTVQKGDQIICAFTNRGNIFCFHLDFLLSTASLPKFRSLICNCCSAVYSLLFTVLNGRSSASAISRKVSSSNSFITRSWGRSRGKLLTASLTAGVVCLLSTERAGEYLSG